MTENIYEFKTNNKEQIFKEADYFRNEISSFNNKSKKYKIDRVVLASNKLSSLFGENDTLFISFKSNNVEDGYKDVGFRLQASDALTIEIHKAQAQLAMDEVKDLLNDMMQSKILQIKPLIELETGKFFKKNVAKEIYTASGHNNNTPLIKSWSVQKDFYERQLFEYKFDNLKVRAKEAVDKKRF